MVECRTSIHWKVRPYLTLVLAFLWICQLRDGKVFGVFHVCHGLVLVHAGEVLESPEGIIPNILRNVPSAFLRGQEGSSDDD